MKRRIKRRTISLVAFGGSWPSRCFAGVLADLDVAGAGVGAEVWAAAVGCAGEVVAVVVLAAELLADADVAGAGGCVEVEAGVEPGLRRMEPELVSIRQSVAGRPSMSIFPEPVWARRPAVTPLARMEPEPVSSFASPCADWLSWMSPEPVWRAARPWTPWMWSEPEPDSARMDWPTSLVSMSPEPVKAEREAARGRMMS